MKRNKELNPVLILGSGINALGVVWSFSKYQMFIYVVDDRRDVASYSKYAFYLTCPSPDNEDEFVDYLIHESSKLSKKSVLLPTSDLYLFAVLKHIKKLRCFYYIPMSNQDIVSRLLEKEYLYSVCEKYSIPHPKTRIIHSVEEIYDAVSQIQYPVIVKPSVTNNFALEMGDKAYIVYNEDELNCLKEKISKTSFVNKPLVIQEYIPGDVQTLYTITSYATSTNDIMGYSIGHKIRQSPPVTGTIISGRVEHVEAIYQAACDFIRCTGFYGISNIEFKKDIRDNSFKLIEINPRTGMWNYSVLSSGINLPYMAYNDVLGFPIKFECNKKVDLVWVITLLDLYNSIWGFKRKGFENYSLSFKEWKLSLRGKKVDAVFRIVDIMPAIVYVRFVISKILKIS